ncbi:MAG: hypothetical protein NTY96_00775 [Bacteroidetes bacterium]|nr:hypothetical protein [Bacteroidota bacterium]
MKPTILDISFFTFYLALIKKRQQLGEEYYSHPTKENEAKVHSLRLQLRQYDAIIQGKFNGIIWN